MNPYPYRATDRMIHIQLEDKSGQEGGFGVTASQWEELRKSPVVEDSFLTSGASLTLTGHDLPVEVGKQINSVDSDQPLNRDIRDLDHWISSQPEWQQERLIAWPFGTFAGLGLALAAIGLYSVVSYTVAQRTDEFGIRMALGAQRSHVLGIVYRSAAMSLGCGISAGVILALSLNKVFAHWEVGSSRDPFTLALVTLLLSVVPSDSSTSLSTIKTVGLRCSGTNLANAYR